MQLKKEMQLSKANETDRNSDGGKVVLVLGGGPAGVVAAVRLADLGHHVTLVNRPRPGEGLEAVPRHVREQLRAHGLEASADTFGPLVKARTVWAGQKSSAQLHVVHRRLLDQALLYDATRRHVNVVDGIAGGIVRSDTGWRVGVGEFNYEGDFLVEARGREAGGKEGGGTVICLTMRYRMPGDCEPFVEVFSFEKGWVRFIAGERREAALQIYLSDDNGDIPAGSFALKNFFEALTGGLSAHLPLLAEAKPKGEVERRNTVSRLREPLIGMDSIRIGEAALALEPLPGSGLEQALENAEIALPVIRAWLAGAGDKQQLAAGYIDRVKADFGALKQSRQVRFGRSENK
ncbi:NAD(P)/FAD-dependent oxidoreductase [Emcibacter sp.]|uniref:NAD(P)/FAD-dependent oxidoreductase n=1 Tax=Emcibacter sp. TaxID=1979954 RepID=UPI003A94AAF3